MRYLTPIALAESTQEIVKAMQTGRTPALANGLCEGYKLALAASLAANQPKRTILYIAANDLAAARMVEDLVALLGNDAVAMLPARPAAFYRFGSESREVVCHRLQTLRRMRRGGLSALVVPVDALMQGLQPHALFDARTMKLASAMRMAPDALCDNLDHAGYERAEKVEAQGQFAARGGLVDIWPIEESLPIRIEFWDDEIDTMRRFDPETQRSVESLEGFTVSPATEALLDECGAARAASEIAKLIDAPAIARALGEEKSDVLPDLWSMDALDAGDVELAGASGPFAPTPETARTRRMQLQCQALLGMLREGKRFSALERMLPYLYEVRETPLDYLDEPWVIIDEPNRCRERAENLLLEFGELYAAALERGDAMPGQDRLMLEYGEILAHLGAAPTLLMQSLTLAPKDFAPRALFAPVNRPSPECHGKINVLAEDIKNALRQGYGVILLTGGFARGERLREALKEFSIDARCEDDALPALGQVFILHYAQSHGFISAEARIAVFAAAEIYGAAQHQRRAAKRRAGAAIESFTDLRVGDAVVHDSHGVGIYRGMVKQELGGAMRDFMLIAYSGGDVLYVPTEQMDRVQKYIGSEDGAPKLNRLGGGEWQRAKQKVRSSIREMATDLVRLYAERQARSGYAFSGDTQWQRQFEDAFPFEPTADQLASISEIKNDMERPQVMDRLLCGDVGYGKTEVAIRAAFKAIMDAKQVAFLAPTTVLAQQHAQTLKRRFEGFPVIIDVISRFRTPQEQKRTLESLIKGEVDILIGTHRLLSADVRWKDLGLLIIDEEHRFGVQHKEQIKELKKSVDVLTLSATPIPRTLHMSMIGIRDMSLLETPPEERYPVQTFVTEFSDGLIRDAVMREMGRGGQVYMLYNRVETIDRMHEHLRRLVPEARIAVGHGQMRENILEDVMLDFYDGKFDVLLCSTIIESGLDVPNANTLIVCEADRFGLAQLYQLRGRVGRSNRLAYAYFTVRPDKVLSETAEKRLSAIREYTEFGSGFKIAMRDLEIRGAGNILGAEQHGHMSAVGYDMYVKLMAETVADLQGELGLKPDIETQIEARVDAYLPAGYGGGERMRVDVYKRIARIDSREEREDVLEELIDRFGDVPHSVLNLVDIAYLKALCQKMQIDKATLTPGLATLRFAPGASLDPAALMTAMHKQANLTLAGRQPPALLLRENGASPEALIGKAQACLIALFEAMNETYEEKVNEV